MFIPTLGGVARAGAGFVATGARKLGGYVKSPSKIGRGLSSAARVAGGAFMAYEAYQGFKQGGLAGGVSSYATMQAAGYGIHAGLRTVGIGSFAGMVPMLAFDAGVATAAYYHRKELLAPTVREHMRKRARLEMGGPVPDPYGTVATTRKRGLMAMRESKLNARSALGNEGTYRYKPYFR